MNREEIKLGNIITLDDGRKVVVTLIHPDSSFEWDLAPDKELEDKDEKEENLKAKATKKAPKTAKSKK